MKKQIKQKSVKYFTELEKHQIIQEFIANQSHCTKVEIWRKYTGQDHEHGYLLRWMRQLGYDTGIIERRVNIVSNLSPMSRKKPKQVSNKEESFETLQYKKRIAELEKQLKEAELKAIAFSTMVDIAEKEFKIPIRKKFNTKP